MKSLSASHVTGARGMFSPWKRPETRLTEDSAYSVRFKVDDGETLVTEGVALDKDADRPSSGTPEISPEAPQGRALYTEMHQEAA